MDPQNNPTEPKVVAKYSLQSLPIVSFVVCNLSKSKLSWDIDKDSTSPELTAIPSGDTLRGDIIIGRYLARLNPSLNLYGNDPFSAAEVDQWIDFAQYELNSYKDEKRLMELCSDLNAYLALRTYFVGYSLTLADVVIWSTLRANPHWQHMMSTNKAQLSHLVRWWTYIDSLPEFKSAVSPTKSSISTTFPATERLGGMPELEGAEMGKVVTRFPPEPSGYLHIGHCKAALLNKYYAKKYNGKLIVRMDDTNPAKEKLEYVENIKRDLQLLDIQPDVFSYTSDYFDKIIEYAELLIKKGLAYCDATPPEQMKKEKLEGVESKYRNTTVEENLIAFNEMKEGTEKGKQYVLRAKIDMKSKNGTLRDPSLMRCVDAPHYRTGKKYKVYPLYDFACPIVDSLEGVTHALRSNEYHDRDAQYKWIQEALGLRPVRIWDFSRLNFSYTLLSKRKLQWFVDKGLVDGWNDPRFPTIQGLMRRGLTVEALEKFILEQGASKNLNNMDMNKLWAVNREILDPIVPRFTAISKENIVPVTLVNGPQEAEFVSVPRHKKNPDLGKKILVRFWKILIEQEDAIRIADGEEVTLMDWGNAIFTKIEKKKRSRDTNRRPTSLRRRLQNDREKTDMATGHI